MICACIVRLQTLVQRIAMEAYDESQTTTANVISVHLGKQQNAANNPTRLQTWYDDFAIDNTLTGLIGPWTNPGNSAPVAEAGIMQTNVEPYTTVTLNGSGSYDGNADPLTYAWT